MNLTKFINTCDDKSYENLKKIFINHPYNLNVKEDSENKNLYMLCYKRNNNFDKHSFLNECRGIILEKNTNKIVCYTLPKINKINIMEDSISTEINNSISNNTEISNNFDWSKVSVEESIDGTHLRLFYYNDKWCVSTTRMIDANKSKWGNRKSYYDMFMDAYENCKDEIFNLDNLNKDYCYGFVLQHPDNEIVIEYNKASLVHVVTRSLKSENFLEELDIDIGCPKPKKYDIDSYTRLLKICYLEEEFETEGYVIVDENRNRYKIKSKNYISYKELKGNYSDELFHFFILRKDSKVQEYLYKFPKNLNKYNLFETYFRKMIKSIHTEYLNKYVFKVTKEVTKNFYPTIKTLHNQYMNGNIIKTKKQNVINEILKLDVKLIYTIFKKYMTDFLSEREIDYIKSEQ